MTEEMSANLETALADGTPCLLATSTKDGTPQISPKGSLAVFDPETLFYWERALRTSQERIVENPKVVVYYRNPQKPGRPTWRFHGRARIVEDPALRELVWERTLQRERDSDPEKNGLAILIDVDLIEDLSGRVLMRRD